MKAFFIKFWKVIMYLSFTSAGIFLIILFSSLESSTSNYGLAYQPEPKYNSDSSFPAYVVVENIVNKIFEKLNIDFQPTSLQICIVMIAFFLLLGFVLRTILKDK